MTVTVFRISPLIRLSLYLLLGALLLPLPVLLVLKQKWGSLAWGSAGVLLGLLALQGLLGQRVEVDAEGLRVSYPAWVPGWLVRGWAVSWTEVASLEYRPTSQGGRAHYLTTTQGQAYLLPMRISGFAQFLRLLQAHSQLDTSTIRPLAQPWMYLALLGCSLGLLGADLWVILGVWPVFHS